MTLLVTTLDSLTVDSLTLILDRTEPYNNWFIGASSIAGINPINNAQENANGVIKGTKTRDGAVGKMQASKTEFYNTTTQELCTHAAQNRCGCGIVIPDHGQFTQVNATLAAMQLDNIDVDVMDSAVSAEEMSSGVTKAYFVRPPHKTGEATSPAQLKRYYEAMAGNELPFSFTPEGERKDPRDIAHHMINTTNCFCRVLVQTVKQGKVKVLGDCRQCRSKLQCPACILVQSKEGLLDYELQSLLSIEGKQRGRPKKNNLGGRGGRIKNKAAESSYDAIAYIHSQPKEALHKVAKTFLHFPITKQLEKKETKGDAANRVVGWIDAHKKRLADNEACSRKENTLNRSQIGRPLKRRKL
jgi:hypothetical protein